MSTSSTRGRLGEIARAFLKLGFTAFGGPAAHIALMHGEFVRRRRWITDQQFLDMLGAANLIPGPNSTETAMFVGFARARWAGLVTAGACFIGPAMLLVMILSWAYVEYGTTPAASRLLYGIKPVVIAIILQALFGLGRRAVRGALTAIAAAGVFVLHFLKVNEILLLIGGGLLVMVIENRRRLWDGGRAKLAALAPVFGLAPLASGHAGPMPLFLTFLKIGSVMYGSGYVLLAFLRADFVTRLGWLTDKQIVDAVAIGQVTPGPLFTSATFIGYLLGGVWGGTVSTIGIFLPSFVITSVFGPFLGRVRESAWAGAFLDGVNATALGLMAAVTLELGRASFPDLFTAILGAAALVLLVRLKVNATWLILGGAAAGLGAFALSLLTR